MEKSITSKTLIRRVPIVEEDVMGELARHPELFVDAARYRVAKMRQRMQAEAALLEKVSTLSLKFRRRLDEDGKRPAEGKVSARVSIHPEKKAAQAALDIALSVEEFAKLILEVYRMRRDSLKILGEAHVYEGRSEDSEVKRIQEGTRLRRAARRLEERRAALRGED